MIHYEKYIPNSAIRYYLYASACTDLNDKKRYNNHDLFHPSHKPLLEVFIIVCNEPVYMPE